MVNRGAAYSSPTTPGRPRACRKPRANSVEILGASSPISRLPSCARKQGLAWCPPAGVWESWQGWGARQVRRARGRRRFKLLRPGSVARAIRPCAGLTAIPRCRASGCRRIIFSCLRRREAFAVGWNSGAAGDGDWDAEQRGCGLPPVVWRGGWLFRLVSRDAAAAVATAP
jgi:hypothetical protein